MSFHAGQTFVYGEQPSATKWQYLWDNDYALADGTGISNDAIINRHIGLAEVDADNIDLTTFPTSIGAWTANTPAVTAVSNSFTNASAVGRWWQFGKLIVFKPTITITTVGSGVGVRVALPVAASATQQIAGGYREVAVGGLTGMISVASSNATLFEYDNSQSLSNGMSFVCDIMYESV